MSAEPTEEDKIENRAIAASMVQTFQVAQTQMLSVSADVAKWLQTSLLAINGAGAIAIIPLPIPATLKIAAGASFVLGVISALLSGYVQLRSYTGIAKHLGATIGYWSMVAIDGWRLNEHESTKDLEEATNKSKFWPSLLSWGAVAAFVIGCAFTGLGESKMLPA